MAVERRDLYKNANKMEDEIEGIKCEEEQIDDMKVTRVRIINEVGAEALDRKIGDYITIDIKKINNITTEKEEKIINTVSKELKNVIQKHIAPEDEILIVGLGNLYATPDSLGSKVVQNIEITRHIKKYLPNAIDKNTRSVSAITPGVLGTTGIETLEIVKGIVDNIKPKLIIAIDSLCSKNIDRINKSIQISDTGIVPGGGVGNRQGELSKDTLGIPVIGIGVPTVLDAATIVIDTLNACKINISEDEIVSKMKLNNFNFIVTPKEIDSLIESMTNVVSESINMSL
jgi:spore protease